MNDDGWAPSERTSFVVKAESDEVVHQELDVVVGNLRRQLRAFGGRQELRDDRLALGLADLGHSGLVVVEPGAPQTSPDQRAMLSELL